MKSIGLENILDVGGELIYEYSTSSGSLGIILSYKDFGLKKSIRHASGIERICHLLGHKEVAMYSSKNFALIELAMGAHAGEHAVFLAEKDEDIELYSEPDPKGTGFRKEGLL